MKKLVIFFSLFVAIPSYAKWTPVGESEGLHAYVDLEGIRKNGNNKLAWSLMDFKSAQKDELGKLYYSSRLFSEYNCSERTVRPLSISQHTKNLGKGNAIFMHNYGPEIGVIHVPPNSVLEAGFKAVCKHEN